MKTRTRGAAGPAHRPDDAAALFPPSRISGNVWPTVTGAGTAQMLAVHHQLSRTQWLAPEALVELQIGQIARLLAHAWRECPLYRERLDAAGVSPDEKLTPALWAAIPLLTREDIQREAAGLCARTVPPHHGKPHAITTSGSTGKPIRVLSTAVKGFFWKAFTLREHLWHRRDFSGKLAAIRYAKGKAAAYPHGQAMANWGPATAAVTATGPGALLSIDTPIAQQAEWLRRQDPAYLLTHPSNAQRLAEYCRDAGIEIPQLRELRLVSEVVQPALRALCREVWGVKVTDMYSTRELGYLAIQCPDHGHYHVQAEGVLLEVLDAAGRPCPVGEIGRVVVTDLHNFAMPLIRYELGDYAEVGGPCACGRGLPVLTRIMGRVRNLVTLPSGAQHWPVFGDSKFNEVAPIRQYQFVQKSREEIELRLVALRDLTAEDEAKLTAIIHEGLGYPFRLRFTYHDEIPRGPGGKFEDFRSEIAD